MTSKEGLGSGELPSVERLKALADMFDTAQLASDWENAGAAFTRVFETAMGLVRRSDGVIDPVRFGVAFGGEEVAFDLLSGLVSCGERNVTISPKPRLVLVGLRLDGFSPKSVVELAEIVWPHRKADGKRDEPLLRVQVSVTRRELNKVVSGLGGTIGRRDRWSRYEWRVISN